MAEIDKYFHLYGTKNDIVFEEVVYAQPERKTGTWIKEPNCYYRCPECGDHYPSIRGYMTYNFCPNCGVGMREVRVNEKNDYYSANGDNGDNADRVRSNS